MTRCPSQPAKADTTPVPPVRQAFCGKFFVFLIEGGRGTLALLSMPVASFVATGTAYGRPSGRWLARKGFPFPPNSPLPLPNALYSGQRNSPEIQGLSFIRRPPKTRKGERWQDAVPNLRPRSFLSPPTPTTNRLCAGFSGTEAVCRKNILFFLSMLKNQPRLSLPRITGGRLFQDRRLCSPSLPSIQVKRAGEGWGFGGGEPLSRQQRGSPPPTSVLQRILPPLATTWSCLTTRG